MNCTALTRFFFLLIFCGFTFGFTKAPTPYHIKLTPVNTIKVSDNFFCDKNEITNANWMEYMYWNKAVFGSKSKQYLASLPDTGVWRKMGCLYTFTDRYLRHPGYREFPVVGITRSQAITYSKWRTDRVYEVMLINKKVMEFRFNQNAENYFSIERYWDGSYDTFPPDSDYAYYSNYRIPTSAEFLSVKSFSEEKAAAFFEKAKSKKCKMCKNNFMATQEQITPCIDEAFVYKPTRPVLSGCQVKSDELIYNLRGNVSEWVIHEDDLMSAGGGWNHSTEDVQKTLFYHKDKERNAWTGFRNVSSWESALKD